MAITMLPGNPSVFLALPCLLVGGTEIHTLMLARALRAGGYRVIVCAYYEHDPIMVRAFEEIGVEVCLLNLRRNSAARNVCRMPQLARAVSSVIRRHRPDVAHVQYMAPGVVPLIAARATGVPHVLATVHVPARHYGRRVWLPRYIGTRMCDVFLCVSEVAERSFFGSSAMFEEDLLQRGRRHFTIHNCVDIERVDAVRRSAEVAALRTRLGLKGRRVVGMVSRLSREKGPLCLMEAMAQVIQEQPSAQLLVVGDGPERQPLLDRARQLGILERVSCTGRLAPEDVYLHLALMDVVVVPSLWEGFGLSAAEAMAFGKPVVASDVDGLREVVVDGQTGLLVPAGNAVALAGAVTAMLRDEDRRTAMGLAGRQRAEQLFSFETFKKQYLRLYRAIVNSEHRGDARCALDSARPSAFAAMWLAAEERRV